MNDLQWIIDAPIVACIGMKFIIPHNQFDTPFIVVSIECGTVTIMNRFDDGRLFYYHVDETFVNEQIMNGTWVIASGCVD